jgi:hypothetical protein
MDYTKNILDKAVTQYPFIKQHDPIVKLGEGEGYAETWPVGEEGPPHNPRPAEFPIDRHAVDIYRPGEFSHHDLAGEILHVDPISNQTREELMSTWTPKQLKTLEKHAKDWQATLDEGRPVEHAIRNATDAAIRGYTLKQWPESINKELKYRPEQKAKLEDLVKYMKTEPGKKSGGAIDKPLKGGSKFI